MIACYIGCLTFCALLHYGKDLPLWLTIILLAVNIVSFIAVASYEEHLRDIVRETIRNYINSVIDEFNDKEN